MTTCTRLKQTNLSYDAFYIYKHTGDIQHNYNKQDIYDVCTCVFCVGTQRARACLCACVGARYTRDIKDTLLLSLWILSRLLSFWQQTKNKYCVLILRRIITFQNDIINISAAILD